MPEPGSRRGSGLWIAWGATVVAAVACGSVFVAGVLRDTHFGEVEIPLDLGAPSGDRGAAFRVWRSGPYDLFLTTLHHGSAGTDSAPFHGSLAVRIVDRGAIRYVG